jgi:hypothetical protein
MNKAFPDNGNTVKELLVTDEGPAVALAPAAPQEARPQVVETWRDLNGGWRVFRMSEWIMRDRRGFFEQVRTSHRLHHKLRDMVLSSLIYLALYGIAMGIPNSWQQALSSMVKLPLLFLLTLLICLPTLYFFNLLYGSQLTFSQTTALLMAAITVTGALTVAFASITFFLWMSVGEQYTILILLNVVVLAVSSWWGLVFLRQGMEYVQQDVSHTRQRSILLVWLVVYAFVGTQMAWSIRPFFGAPGEPFVLMRQDGGTFYESVVTALIWLTRTLLGWG